MNPLRRCCRPGCQNRAAATLTFVYSDSTAVVGPLARTEEPHSWDLCADHAARITAPRGWELVRYEGSLASGDDDDLTALAEAVREAARGDVPAVRPRITASTGGSGETVTGAHSAPTSRRRGHLRVLPDPAE